MHIGFLTPEYAKPDKPEGGLANYLNKVGRALADHGHDISIFVISDQDVVWQDGNVWVYEVERVDLPKWIFPTRRARQIRQVLSQYLSSRRLVSKLWEVYRQKPIDLVQASSYNAPGYALLHNGTIPMVCRISSYTPLYRSAYGRQRSFDELLSDWMEIRQVLDVESAFAPSRLMANAFSRLEGYRPQIIRTPIDQQNIEADASFYQTYLGGKSYLLYFGTLSRIKGVDLLADAIPPVLGRYPDLCIVFIGRDDGLPNGQNAFDYVVDKCKKFQSRLHYYASLPKFKLFPVIAKALGVLMPSRIDNYPNACLEALLNGVPVIGTFDSSLDEMIVDGETGFLAKNDDPSSLCDAIMRLLSLSPWQRKEMQERILKSVEAINAEDRVGQLIAYYRETIADFQSDGN
jgi:glycosyltransferase involved in cell wall biosynthesis